MIAFAAVESVASQGTFFAERGGLFMCGELRSGTFLLGLFGWLFSLGQPAFAQKYQWRSVAIHGGGYVSGLIFVPTQQGLLFARTDVGGAYKYQADHWVPLTDWVSEADGNLLGCESIAIDPADPNHVYLALGTYTNDWGGLGAFARSSDGGKSFELTRVPFKMGGNDPGRGVGERLTVDPNDGRVLFFGSRAAGLWTSRDASRTWQKIEGFPAAATSPEAYQPGSHEWAYGISFVVCDPRGGSRGNPSSTIYAAVCTLGTNLFRSIDAGKSWAPVPNQPTGLRPIHMAVTRQGMAFISYSDEAPPGNARHGAIWQLDMSNDRWTDITPVAPSAPDPFGYGGISVSEQNEKILMGSTYGRWNRGDSIFRSIDGGQHWSAQTVGTDSSPKTRLLTDSAPWASSIRPHWITDLKIDPFDSSHALFVTGFGVWSTRDADSADSDKPVHWKFDDDGLEEAVPVDLVSPPAGAHLISAIGDYDGFCHDDLNVPARAGRHTPNLGSEMGLDFAEHDPGFVVRVNDRGKGCYSNDGGHSWKSFASHPPFKQADGGHGIVAVSCDANTVLWITEKDKIFRTADVGNSWTAASGPNQPRLVISDRMNPAVFYCADLGTAHLMRSTDGGVTFAELPWRAPGKIENLQSVAGFADHIWFTAGQKLYRSTDGGKTIVAVQSSARVSRLGFGKAPAGSNYPAIFIAGGVAGEDGIFRSDDQGSSWIKINDDQHQFGRLNLLVGDPRVFGRVYLGTSGRGIIVGDSELSAAAVGKSALR